MLTNVAQNSHFYRPFGVRLRAFYCSIMGYLFQKLLLAIIWVYQRMISPLTPPSCRFTPTCSAYAAEAVTKYGPLKGGKLALKRLSKCHPWGSSGYDPVP